MTAVTLPARRATVVALPSARQARGGHHNKGLTFPPDPITAEDMAPLLGACAPQTRGTTGDLAARRLRAMLVILYRTGLRCSEMLDLELRDLIDDRRAILVRHGKGDKQRVVAVDRWGWAEIQAWATLRREQLPPGKLLCHVRQPRAGSGLTSAYVRQEMRRLRARASVQKRVAPHQFRHGHAVELWREGVDLLAVQRQLGHARLDVTQVYLRGLDPLVVLEPISDRPPPMILLR